MLPPSSCCFSQDSQAVLNASPNHPYQNKGKGRGAVTGECGLPWHLHWVSGEAKFKHHSPHPFGRFPRDQLWFLFPCGPAPSRIFCNLGAHFSHYSCSFTWCQTHKDLQRKRKSLWVWMLVTWAPGQGLPLAWITGDAGEHWRIKQPTLETADRETQ